MVFVRLAEMERFELSLRFCRTTAFRVRTLQPLGYISLCQLYYYTSNHKKSQGLCANLSTKSLYIIYCRERLYISLTYASVSGVQPTIALGQHWESNCISPMAVSLPLAYTLKRSTFFLCFVQTIISLV